MPSNGCSWPDPEARPTINGIVWTMAVVTTSEVGTKPKHGMPSRQTRCPRSGTFRSTRSTGRWDAPSRSTTARTASCSRGRDAMPHRRADTTSRCLRPPPPVPSDEPVVPVPERVVEDDRTVPVRALPLGPPFHSYTTPAGPSFHHVARAMYAATAATATTIGETIPVFESVFGFNGEGIRCTPVIRFKYQSRIPVSWPAEA